MAFPLLLLYLALTFVRPADLYPDLARFRTMELAGAALTAATVVAMMSGRGSRPRAPQSLLVIAFVAWASFSSVAAQRWLGGAAQPFDKLTPSLFLFFAMALNVDSTRRLRWTAIVLSALAVFLAVQATLAYHFGIRAESLLIYEGISAGGADLPEGQREEEISRRVAEGTAVPRVRSVGFLNDPNDLAQALVAILPFLVALRRRLGRLGRALFVWAPAGLIIQAIALTRSRGGLLALAAVVFLTFRHRLGHVVSAVFSAAALGGFLFLGFVGGRSLAMDESSQGRTEAWYAGIQMLKASPVWGVGFGAFEEQHERVAHNSFVHCFAEVGLVGYFLWLAIIVLTVADLVAVGGGPPGSSEAEEGPEDQAGEGGDEGESDELSHWGRAALHSLGGYLTGALFLSRTYNVVLFLLLGVGVAISDQARRRDWGLGSPSALVWTVWIGLVEFASLATVSLAIRSLH